jgi:hypothetical protein
MKQRKKGTEKLKNRLTNRKERNIERTFRQNDKTLFALSLLLHQNKLACLPLENFFRAFCSICSIGTGWYSQNFLRNSYDR